MKKNLALVLLVMLSVSCGKLEELAQVDADTAIADSVEAAITSLGAISDEQSEEDLSAYKKSQINKVLDLLNPMKSAYAATCSGRAAGQFCSGGEKNITYSDCDIYNSNQTLNGNVKLVYSDTSNCDIDTVGESVTRTYDFTRTTGWGAQIRTHSENKTDYEGNNYGGGAVLTNTASGYEVEILGKHKERTSAAGRARMDVSIRTTSPLSFDELDRDNRTVNSGTLVVAHNILNYKVEMSPNNLEYSSSCCYPIGGTMDLTYSGTISASGVVSFNGCGSATVTRADESYEIEFYSCE